MHDALEVALLFLRLRDGGGGGILLAPVDELALVPSPDDGGAEAAVDGVGAPDDADALLLGRGEHAADAAADAAAGAAAVSGAIVDGDSRRKVGRLPRGHR